MSYGKSVTDSIFLYTNNKLLAIKCSVVSNRYNYFPECLKPDYICFLFLYLYYISWFPNMYWYSLMDSRDFSGSLLVNPDVWMGFLIGIPGLKLWYNSNPFSFQASKVNFKNMLTIIKKGKKYVQLKTKTTWTMLCLHAVLFFALTVQQLNKTAAAVH